MSSEGSDERAASTHEVGTQMKTCANIYCRDGKVQDLS